MMGLQMYTWLIDVVYLISVCVLPKPVYSSQTLTGSEGVLEILTRGAILIRVYKMSICWMKSNDSSTL